jgi:hypothetical protein
LWHRHVSQCLGAWEWVITGPALAQGEWLRRPQVFLVQVG